VVVIAGKGHEDYQIYGTVKRPFSDQAVVSEELAAAASGTGNVPPQDPGLQGTGSPGATS
jgi:hypothetical protein